MKIEITENVTKVVVEIQEQDHTVTLQPVIRTSGGGGGDVKSVNGKTGVVELSTSDIQETTDKNYVTDSEKTVLGNTSNTNTGDETTNTIKTKRPLKTIGGESLEGNGVINIDSNFNKYGNIKTPSNFNTTFGDLYINRKVNETARLLNITSESLRKFYPDPTVIYIDPLNGNDSNNGSDWNNAVASLSSTVLSSADRFYVRGDSNLSTNFYVNQDIEVISVNGTVNYFRGVNGDMRSWTDEGNGVWSNVITVDPPKIFDSRHVDSRGELEGFVRVNDLASVQSTQNSYYKDSVSNKLYIHTFDDLTPSINDVMIVTTDQHLHAAFAKHLYFEGINFVTGVFQNRADAELHVYKDCKFTNSSIDGYTGNIGDLKVFFDNCIATKNFADGFNYKDNINAIELNCISNYNGLDKNDSINNGSTGHGNSIQIRIGGVYHNNEGRQVHDVNNSKSLNIDCLAYDSVSVDSEVKGAFAIGTGNIPSETAEMWLDGCVTKTNEDTYGAISATSYGDIYTRNSHINNIKTGTVLTPY